MRCDTWVAEVCCKEGLRLTVPKEAQQLLGFPRAGETGGDFKTLDSRMQCAGGLQGALSCARSRGRT